MGIDYKCSDLSVYYIECPRCKKEGVRFVSNPQEEWFKNVNLIYDPRHLCFIGEDDTIKCCWCGVNLNTELKVQHRRTNNNDFLQAMVFFGEALKKADDARIALTRFSFFMHWFKINGDRYSKNLVLLTMFQKELEKIQKYIMEMELSKDVIF